LVTSVWFVSSPPLRHSFLLVPTTKETPKYFSLFFKFGFPTPFFFLLRHFYAEPFLFSRCCRSPPQGFLGVWGLSITLSSFHRAEKSLSPHYPSPQLDPVFFLTCERMIRSSRTLKEQTSTSPLPPVLSVAFHLTSVSRSSPAVRPTVSLALFTSLVRCFRSRTARSTARKPRRLFINVNWPSQRQFPPLLLFHVREKGEPFTQRIGWNF